MTKLAPTFAVTRDDAKREIHWSASGMLSNTSLNELLSQLLEKSKPFRHDKQGFRVLGDLRELAVQQRHITDMFQYCQEVTASFGVDRFAVLYSSMLVKQQFRRVSDALDCQFFESKTDAIAWLREPRHQNAT